MNRLILLSALVGTWTAYPASLEAQQRAVIADGDRVRISAPEFGNDLIVGDVVARSADTLTLNCWQADVRKWELMEVPVRSISSLEVSRGTRSNTGKGAVLGGLIGSAFGLAAGIAAASYDCNADPWDWDGCWYWGDAGLIPISTITFGLIGAGAGALIGNLTRTENWQPIPSDRLSVRLAPADGGLTLALSVDF